MTHPDQADHTEAPPSLELEVVRVHAHRAHELTLALYYLQSGLQHYRAAGYTESELEKEVRLAASRRDSATNMLNSAYIGLRKHDVGFYATGYTRKAYKIGESHITSADIEGNATFNDFRAIGPFGITIGLTSAAHGHIWVPLDMLDSLTARF